MPIKEFLKENKMSVGFPEIYPRSSLAYCLPKDRDPGSRAAAMQRLSESYSMLLLKAQVLVPLGPFLGVGESFRRQGHWL